MLRVHSSCRWLEDTLDMISNQTAAAKVYAFCCSPSDEVRSLLNPYVEHIYTISQETYDTWGFLNRSMEMTEAELVVFLDGECTPVDVHWLAKLLEPFRSVQAGAAFSRMLPASDAGIMIMNDLVRVFDEQGDLFAENHRHYFSSSAMACRRSLWEENPFPVEEYGAWASFVWSWQARRRGVEISYAKHARVLYTRSYALRSVCARGREAGRAEAKTFSWEPKEITLHSYALKPAGMQIREDLRQAWRMRHLSVLLYAPLVRLCWYLCRYRSFRRTYARRR